MSTAVWTDLAAQRPFAVRPVHFAAVAMVLTLLLSPVSQLTPEGAIGKVPMLVESAILGGLMLRWMIGGLRPWPVRPLVWLAVAILHAVLTGLWAIDQRICFTYGLRALHAAMCTFGLFAAIENRRDFVTMITVLHGIGCLSAAVGIAQWLLPALQVDFVKENTDGAVGAALIWEDELGAGSIVRVTGTMAHPLGLALLLGVTLPWTPALWQAHPGRIARALLLGSAGVQLIGLGLTYSRMAFLALGISVAIYILRGGIERRAAVLVSLACAGLVGLPLLPATLRERVLDPTHFEQSDSLIARMEMQVYGSDIAMEHGFVGVGYGCYGVVYEATAMGRYVEQTRWMLARDEYTAYDLGDVGAHNTYLEIVVEQGLPGLLLVGGCIVSMWLGFRRLTAALPIGSLDRNFGLCCEAGMAALITSTLVIHMQEAPMPWVWIGSAAAWLGLPRGGQGARP